jgi:hypothetical protein
MFGADTITVYSGFGSTTGFKYYFIPANANSYIHVRWADASDGGSDFSPVLNGNIVVSAIHADTGEQIFVLQENGYSTWTTFPTGTGNIILEVVGTAAGSFGIRWDY